MRINSNMGKAALLTFALTSTGNSFSDTQESTSQRLFDSFQTSIICTDPHFENTLICSKIFSNQRSNSCDISNIEGLEIEDGETLKITYEGEEYDLTEFNKKVLIPVEYFIKANYDADFDKDFLLRIAIIENMGSIKKDRSNEHYEVSHVLQTFANDYTKTYYRKSSAGARGTFQVIKSTQNALEKKYQVLLMLDGQDEFLANEFGIETLLDKNILINGLYAGVYLHDTKIIGKNLGKKGPIKGSELAGAYNLGPSYFKGKNSKETRLYLNKYNIVDGIIVDGLF